MLTNYLLSRVHHFTLLVLPSLQCYQCATGLGHSQELKTVSQGSFNLQHSYFRWKWTSFPFCKLCHYSFCFYYIIGLFPNNLWEVFVDEGNKLFVKCIEYISFLCVIILLILLMLVFWSANILIFINSHPTLSPGSLYMVSVTRGLPKSEILNGNFHK